MTRTLRYASTSFQSLRTNPQHVFAARHALMLYRSNAIYSFIPKNACSTLRVTLALENGCIQEISDFNWIHKNNDIFVADLPALIKASYAFVVLRCPFARVASAFLDKIVGHTVEAWQMHDMINRRREVSDFTFDFFVRKLAEPSFKNSNIHWRPQLDFLVYEDYDDYFCLEKFADAAKILQEKIGLTVVDARALTGHGIGKYQMIDDGRSFQHATALEIMNLKAAGQCPSPAALFSEELVEIIRQSYQQDIQFYVQQFGEEQLLFPPSASATSIAAIPLPQAKPSAVCCNICGAGFVAQAANECVNESAKESASLAKHACSKCCAQDTQRAERQLMQALPSGFLSWRRGLQIGAANGVSGSALQSLQKMPANAATFAELNHQADGSFDFIAVSEGWQQIPDPAATFTQLSRLLSANGVLQISCEAEAQRHVVQTLLPHLIMLPLQIFDKCSGRELSMSLFLKDEHVAAKIQNWQLSWRQYMGSVEN